MIFHDGIRAYAYILGGERNLTMKKLVFLSLIAWTLSACFGTEESTSDEPSSEAIRDSLLIVLDSIGVNTASIDDDLLDSLVTEYDSYDFDKDELEELFKEQLKEDPHPIDSVKSVDQDTSMIDTTEVDSALTDPVDEAPDYSMDSSEIAALKALLIGNWVSSEEVLLPITKSEYKQDPVQGFIEIKDTLGYDTLYNELEFQFTEDDLIREIRTQADPYFPIVETLEGSYEIVDGVILYRVKTNAWAQEHLYALKVGELLDGSLKLSPALVGTVEIESPLSDSVKSAESMEPMEEMEEMEKMEATQSSDSITIQDSNKTQNSTGMGQKPSLQAKEVTQVGLVNSWYSSRVVFVNRIGSDQEGMISITDSEINAYYISASDTNWVIQSNYSELSPGEVSLANVNELTDVSYQYQIISNKLVLYNPLDEEIFGKK